MTIEHDIAGYALFKDGTQITQAHPTRADAMMEAFRRRVVLSWSHDFWSDKSDASLATGYEVKETMS